MADAWGGSWGTSWADSWGGAGAPAVTVRPNWDTSDPLFYNFWRRLKDKNKKQYDEVQAISPAAVREIEKVVSQAPLRPETLAGISDATSLQAIRDIRAEASKAERQAIDKLLAIYERERQEDDDIETLLVMLQ